MIVTDADQRRGFKTPLRVEWVDRRRWELIEPLVYVDAEGKRHVAPKGTVTDFASVPRLLRWLVARDAELARASVIHDTLIPTGTLAGDLEADALFREMSERDTRFWWRAWAAWRGVRIGSWCRAIKRSFKA